jgi:mono/diheme cytochrome c family protein
MKKILLGALVSLGFGAAVAAVLIQSGTFDFAADAPHNPAIYRLIEWARERSIARRAADIVPPADLSDAGRIRRGAGNYDAMCVDCHLAPGVDDSEIRKCLYPTPPNLAKAPDGAHSVPEDARRFWTIKHGVKGSGMPAWSKGGMEDGAIWDITAFLKVMPDLSPEAYHRQVEASEGHSHGGTDPHRVRQEEGTSGEHSHDAEAHSHDHGHTHTH